MFTNNFEQRIERKRLSRTVQYTEELSKLHVNSFDERALRWLILASFLFIPPPGINSVDLTPFYFVCRVFDLAFV